MKLSVISLLTMLLAATQAFACGAPTNPIFVDDFSGANQSAWTFGNTARYGVNVGPNTEMTVAPPPRTVNYPTYNQPVGTTTDICVRMRMTGGAGNAGIMFWHVSDDNFFTAKVDAKDGSVWIAQLVNNKWNHLADSNGKFVGAFNNYNELEVRTTANTAEVWIAGSKVLSINSTAPAGGGQAGVIADNETENPGAFVAHFARFAVYRPSSGGSAPPYNTSNNNGPNHTGRPPAAAAEVKIQNDYRVPIVKLYFSPHSATEYGDNRLSATSVIHSGYLRTWSLDPGECAYDFKAEFDNDNTQELTQDVCKDNTVHFSGGPAGKLLSLGSGFYIDDDGHIMTNNHVVYGCGQMAISQGMEGDRILTVVGQNSADDLALLKEDGIRSAPLPFRPAELPARAGETATALGYPLSTRYGTALRITTGAVSSTEVSNGPSLFQLQTPINHGNSGGPVVDSSGRVIGISVLTAGDSAQNTNFAVSGVAAQRFARSLGIKAATSAESETMDPADIYTVRGASVVLLKCIN